MFAGRTVERATGAGLNVLQALALADRVPRENDKAFAREILENGLVAAIALAIGGVAEGREYAGCAAGRRFGKVEVTRDVKLGLAFEDHFFDAVCLTIDPARDAFV